MCIPGDSNHLLCMEDLNASFVYCHIFNYDELAEQMHICNELSGAKWLRNSFIWA